MTPGQLLAVLLIAWAAGIGGGVAVAYALDVLRGHQQQRRDLAVLRALDQAGAQIIRTATRADRSGTR